jgi:hypothetical protein
LRWLVILQHVARPIRASFSWNLGAEICTDCLETTTALQLHTRCSQLASSWLYSVMVSKLYKACRCCWTSNDRLAQPIHQLSPTCMSAAPMPSPLARRVSVELSLSHATAFFTAASCCDSVGQLQRAFYTDMTPKSGSTRTQSAVLTARPSRQISDFFHRHMVNVSSRSKVGTVCPELHVISRNSEEVCG